MKGVVGFIGIVLVAKLIAAGHRVIGVNNLNDYYDLPFLHSVWLLGHPCMAPFILIKMFLEGDML
ncbi:hypothetical protein [Shewanella sp. Isolate11]|uniref:hypothetical protein n=1 Tax=Shewanella sp. Isolate11 TaxID=2908530 RepID=UPI001EFDD2F3|nr:hypothetical protein [Shewanella sp. Isolate11]MCG9697100.1 hypothetical protein [Shewanella sp. Isolate11]